MKDLFQKSIVLNSNLPAGTILEKEHLALKKPGSGLQAELIEKIIGRCLIKDVTIDQLLSLDDIEDFQT